MHTGASLSGTQGGGVSVDVDSISLIMVSPLHTIASSPFSISITGVWLFIMGIISEVINCCIRKIKQLF